MVEEKLLGVQQCPEEVLSGDGPAGSLGENCQCLAASPSPGGRLNVSR